MVLADSPNATSVPADGHATGVAGPGVSLLDGLEASAPSAGGGDAPVAPDWVLAVYLCVVVCGGVVANAALASSIVRRRRRRRRRGPRCGDPHLLGLLLCLAVADAASLLLVAPFEVIVLGGSPDAPWTFSSAYCRVFLGLEVLLGSVAAYAVLAVNLHAVIGWNNRDGAECGAGGERPGGGSGARAPVALVWLLAASLSVPAFVAADVVEARPPHRLCTARGLGFGAHVLLATFRAAVPACALLACAGAAALRLCGGGGGGAGAGGAGDERAARRNPLRVALWLALSFAAMSLHRAVFAALHPLLPSTAAARGPAAFASPPLTAAPATPLAALAFAMLHHALPSLRPLLACAAGRGLRDQLRPHDYEDDGCCCDGCCCCCCCSPCAKGPAARHEQIRLESEVLR